MDLLWIPISIFAALMQAVRTAAQKDLNAHLSTMTTTYVRSLFGLPFLVLYLLIVQRVTGAGMPELGTPFWLYGLGAALAQVAATWLLIYLFTIRNFAVGSMLPKADIMMTAILGSLFFSESISLMGWIAIAATLLGVLMISVRKTDTSGFQELGKNPTSAVFSKPIQIGLLTALCFTFSYLFLREASLSLNLPFLQSAAWTVVAVTLLQVLLVGAWLLIREPSGFHQMWIHRRPSIFIGLTSALGSIGWFTAMTMQNASYVKAVGQIEALFTLAISWLYFKERSTAAELCGIILIVAGVLLFIF